MSDLEKQLDYTFQRVNLLKKAVTHKSFVHEQGLDATDSNERLEFLGDAVLQLCISDLLYHRFPDLPEGELTLRRAALVCEESLAKIAVKLGISEFVLLGQGEVHTGGRKKESILSDALEALFGAIYLDGGMDSVQNVIFRLFKPLAEKGRIAEKDSKTTLQEILQKNNGGSAVYTILGEQGPPHQRKFKASVSHSGVVLGTGTGRSKKEAEQSAAKVALKGLKASKQ